jgi:hypothetical protein
MLSMPLIISRRTRNSLEAVKQEGRALCYASNNIKNDIEIVVKAAKQNRVALQYVCL